MRFLAIIISVLFSIGAYAHTITYFYDVNGITPRLSKKSEVIHAWGKPKNSDANKYGTNLIYDGFKVTFTGKSDVVNTIIITEESFDDLNGVSVGDRVENVLSLKGCLAYASGFILDVKSGLGYWINSSRVERIVYGGTAVVNKNKLISDGWRFKNDCGFLR